MRVLVSGSSGLVGRALTKKLTEQGQEPVALRRSASASSPDTSMWEPIQRGTWTSDVGPVDAVVHLAGENIAGLRWTPEVMRRIRESRVIGTEQLCRHLVGLDPRPKALVAASAIGYYGNRGDDVLTESAPSGSGFLAEVCRDWEDSCMPAAEAGIRVVHIRIGMVLAPDGGALARLLPLFRLALGGKLGSGRQWMSWISLDDLIEIILRALRDETLAGPVNAVAPDPLTNYEFTKTLGRIIKRPTVFAVPAFALRLALGEMADALLLASTRAVPARLNEIGYQYQHPDIEDALRSIIRVEN